MSNEVLSGGRDLKSLTFRYDGLKGYGVGVVHDTVTAIDAVARKVSTPSKGFAYDRLIVAPGVDFKWDAIPGHDEAASAEIPHAWKAGEQTLLLRKQLEAMPDGGVFVIVAPPNPYRCPPGPYERAALVGHYFKTHKPKSKIIILDPKDNFSKQGLFQAGWEEHYPGMISWVGAAAGGTVERIDAKARSVQATVEKVKASVLNVIPPQRAGAIAVQAGLADKSGWCPVNQRTFESTIHKDVYVIGDAAVAGDMPKSGYAANTQAKVCVNAILASLEGKAGAAGAGVLIHLLQPARPRARYLRRGCVPSRRTGCHQGLGGGGRRLTGQVDGLGALHGS